MTATAEKTGHIQAHYSSLTMHRKCPQAWYYRYTLGLKQPDQTVAPERDFGSWWSAIRAAEALERGRQFGSLKQEPRTIQPIDGGPKFDMKTLVVQDVMEAALAWWQTHHSKTDFDGKTAAELWDERLGKPLPELLPLHFDRHQDMYQEQNKTEQPLGVEVFWRRPLPSPNDSWQTEGYPDMVLIGFIDQLFWDTQREMVVARDDKTSKQLRNSTVDDMMDSQLQLYAWGADPLVREWTGNQHSIRAVSYDRVKSIAPKPPSLTLAGRLRQHKGEPTVGMTDLKTYMDWVESKPEFPGTKKDGSGAGIYEAEDKVIEVLKTSAAQANWFQRTQTPLNRNIIQTHLRAAVDSAVDMYRTTNRVAERHEAQRNLTNACTWCDFANLCRAQMVGGADGSYELDQFYLKGKDGQQLLEDGRLV